MARITLRPGLDKPTATRILGSTPSAEPASWIRRQDVADELAIDIRTVDRYIREKVLSSYAGPVPGRLYGVRIWADDVEHLRPETVAEVTK